jgi:hypothetical protein
MAVPEEMETLMAPEEVEAQETFLVLAEQGVMALLVLSSLRSTHNGFLRNH